MADAKALLLHPIQSPPDVKVVEKDIPEAISGTVVDRVLAAGIGPGRGCLISHNVPAFLGSDSVSIREGQLVLVDPFTIATDDSNVEILHAIPLDEEVLVRKHSYEIEELTMIQRLSVAYGAISHVDIEAGETAIVSPATGQFGSAAVEIASAVDARVIALGRNQETLAKLKATIPHAYIDFSLHTMHSEPSYIRSAMEPLRKRGRVALMSGLSGTIALPYFLMIVKSLELKGKWMYTRPEIGNFIKMVETRTLKIGKAAEHQVHGKFKREEHEAALEIAAKHTGQSNALGQRRRYT
ncbi:GroES-like protein [Xylariaceae sp. AK1471]|nr:GroES-like protein [Xylariaceae sp. AK1471]